MRLLNFVFCRIIVLSSLYWPTFTGAQWLDFLPVRGIEARAVRTLQIRDLLERKGFHNRPYERYSLSESLWQEQPASFISPYEFYLFNRLKSELRPEYSTQNGGANSFLLLELTPAFDLNSPEGIGDFRSNLLAQAWGSLGKHWAARTSFVVDTDRVPQYHNRREWNGLNGDFVRGFFSYTSGGFSFWAGRNEIWWGPSIKSSLILSDNAPTMDAVGLQLKYGIFGFSSFHAFLQRNNAREDSLNINSFFAGHRLDIRLHRNLILGFYELVRYGGPGESITPGYLNPFFSYYVIDILNFQNRRDNVLLGADLSYFLKDRSLFYAQLLIDEYILDKDEDYPNATAFLFGFEVLYPFGVDGLNISGEFAKIGRWVYYYPQEYFWNRYLYLGQSLGHWLGADGYVVNLDASWYAGSNLIFDITTSFARKGEGDPTTSVRPNRSTGKFLSGIVENTFRTELSFTYSPQPEQFIRLRLGYEKITNHNHVSGNSSSGFEIRAQFGYRLRIRY